MVAVDQMAAAQHAPDRDRRGGAGPADGAQPAAARGDDRRRPGRPAAVRARAVGDAAVLRRDRRRRRGRPGLPARHRRRRGRGRDRPDAGAGGRARRAECPRPAPARDRPRHGDADPGPHRRAGAHVDRRPGRAVARRGRRARPAARAAAARRRPGRRPAGGGHHADLAARHRRPAAPRRSRAVAAPAATRPAAGADRHRCRRDAGRAGHQGGGAGRHGPARPGHRGDRLGQVRAAPDPGPGPGPDPPARRAQFRPGGLQGRRHLPGPGPSASRIRRDHQPGGRAAAGGPDARRAERRAGPQAGTAARGGQLRLAARLHPGPRGGGRPAAGAHAVRGDRRVLRAAVGPAGVHRPVRHDRAAGTVARRAPAARLAAPRGGPAARPGHPPVLPDRPAHVLRLRVPGRAGRPGRLRAAFAAGQRLPEVRHRRHDPVQGGVRLGPGGRRAGPLEAPGPAGDRALRPRLHPARGDRRRAVSAGGAARGAGREPARHRGEPATRAGPGRARDLAAAAGRAAHAGPAAAAAVDHAALRVRGREPGLARQAPRGYRDRGPAVRPAPRPAVGRPGRGGRPRRRRRRAAQRQVHHDAHPDQLAGLAAHATGDPVLLPRLRRRVAGRAGRPAPRRRRRHPAGPHQRPAHGGRGPGRAHPPGEGVRRAAHRVDLRLPPDAGQR